ncbi:MAG: GGDEF domain-containing protein [Patescibacteria group bacterium]
MLDISRAEIRNRSPFKGLVLNEIRKGKSELGARAEVAVQLSELHSTPLGKNVLNELRKATKEKYEEKEKAEEFKKLSSFDPLTGLRNWRYLFGDKKNPNSHGEMRRLFLEAKRSGNDLSVIMLDGDNFKKINDTYGHSEGDVVLGKLADIILSTARESDIVARYGGEEFIVILQDTGLKEAKILADRINKDVKEANIPNNNEAKQTISVGVACYSPKNNIETINEKDLINQADEALYKAKNTGRDKVIVYGSNEFNKPTKK